MFGYGYFHLELISANRQKIQYVFEGMYYTNINTWTVKAYNCSTQRQHFGLLYLHQQEASLENSPSPSKGYTFQCPL